MKSRNKLKWESEVGASAKGWVAVIPSSGNGDTKVTIKVDNEVGWADPDTLSGTVTFRCTTCELIEEKEKTIDVCRCACSCCDLSVTPTVTDVPEEGLEENKPIGTYTLTSRCGSTKISGTITKRGGTEQPLTIEDENIKLTNAIPYNQEMSKAYYDVKIFFDRGNLPDAPNTKCNGCCNPCTSWTITQAALECNCGNTVRGKVTYGEYFNGTKEIPQSGLTVGTQLFRYTLKQYCPHAPQLSAKITYASTTRNVTISNGIATLAQAIGPNDNTSKRDITIKVYYNGEECESKPTKQVGCTCENVLPNDEQFEVSIPTFNQNYVNECEDGQPCIAVKVGDKIGTYVKKAGTTCPETAITATLVSNGITYPLTCVNNGEVRLGGTRNILENSSHNPVPFTATVYYNGEECDSDQINQPGVACNCEDIRGKVSNFNVIPKPGATAGFILGTYSLAGTQCSDANNCMKIEEVNNLVGVKLENGKVKTTTDIPNNEDPLVVDFTFKVYYKVNDKWRECSTITTYQKGMECSCASITVSTESEVSEFPYAGTHGEWVTFASGDTGLYKYKGTPQQEFAGVCGKLLAVTESGYLNVDNDPEVEGRVSNVGDYIRVIGVKLTEEERAVIIRSQGEDYLVPHIYYLQANIKEITGIDDKLSLVPVLYFYKRVGTEWVEEKCTNKRCLFYISGDACDCNKKPDLTLDSKYANPVPCEGTSGIKELGSISNKNSGMTITAELLNSETSLIKNFSYNATTTKFYVSGNVETANDTGKVRDVGTIRLTYTCNKGKPNEWSCGYKDFVVKQEKCPVCDCDYIKYYCYREHSQYTYNEDVYLHHDETTATKTITRTFTLDCGKLAIVGEDETTHIYDGGWYTAYLTREYSYYGYYYTITITLKEGQEHANREDVMTIHAFWYNPETEQWEYCTEFTVTVHDEACSCSALDNVSWGKLPDSTGKTLTISGEIKSGFIDIGYTSVNDCIEFFIVGEDPTTHKYRDPGEYIEAYVWNYSTYGIIYVDILKDLVEPIVITIGARYKKSDGTWEECVEYKYQLTIKHTSCDCSAFKNKVSFTTSFNQTDSKLYVAYINPGCGKGRLFVNCNGSDYCCASDLPDDCDLKGVITSINGCTNTSFEGAGCCGTGNLYLDVTDLPEDTTRTINVAVYWCNDDGTLYKDDQDNYCFDSATITQTYTRSCSDVSCYNYSIGIPALYEINLPAGSPLTQIATYNALPENYEDCFEISIRCSDERVADFQYDNTTISMALKSGVTGQVTVDITSKYKPEYGDKTQCEYSQIIVHIT